MTLDRRELERGLQRAERTIALVERCRPRNGSEEQARVVAAWRRGEEIAPRYEYAPARALPELSAALEKLSNAAAKLGEFGELYAARARELAVEAELAESVGAPAFALRAARRFDAGRDEHAARAREWAEEWTRSALEPDPDPGIFSDDERDPESLISAMRRAVGRERLPFRVLLQHDLPAAAATGDGVIVVRSGVRQRAWEVRRIVVHEVMGHALPRARAAREPVGLYLVGSAGGSDDEEGRALLIEEREGCLCSHRKAELGRRHLAALAVRDGASFIETVRLVKSRGAALEAALGIAHRVHRGGGLAREIVYLPALSRVKQALSAEPELENWLERGRISVAAAAVLRDLGDPPDQIRPSRAA